MASSNLAAAGGIVRDRLFVGSDHPALSVIAFRYLASVPQGNGVRNG